MREKKIYRVTAKRTEIYSQTYEATSKEDAIRQFNEDIDEGCDWYDVGKLVINARVIGKGEMA